MALMICVECGQEVSDRANVCAKCGFPIQEHVEKEGGQVRIYFPPKHTFGDTLVILNEQGERLGTIKQGETAFFSCPHAINISVRAKTMIGWNTWGKSTKTVHPGKCYEIKINFVGKLSLVEV